MPVSLYGVYVKTAERHYESVGGIASTRGIISWCQDAKKRSFAAIIRNGPTIRKPVATWEGDESPFEVSEMQWVHVEGDSLVDIDIKPLNGKLRPRNNQLF